MGLGGNGGGYFLHSAKNSRVSTGRRGVVAGRGARGLCKGKEKGLPGGRRGFGGGGDLKGRTFGGIEMKSFDMSSNSPHEESDGVWKCKDKNGLLG